MPAPLQTSSGDGSRRAGGYHAVLAGLSAQYQAPSFVAELPTARCFSRGGEAYLGKWCQRRRPAPPAIFKHRPLARLHAGAGSLDAGLPQLQPGRRHRPLFTPLDLLDRMLPGERKSRGRNCQNCCSKRDAKAHGVSVRGGAVPTGAGALPGNFQAMRAKSRTSAPPISSVMGRAATRKNAAAAATRRCKIGSGRLR